MYGWTEEAHTRARTYLRTAFERADEVFATARAMVADPATADVGTLLRAFIDGVGSHVDVAFYRLRQMTDEVGCAAGLIGPDESFFNDHWGVDLDILEQYCPNVLNRVFAVRDNAALDVAEILDWCPNECMDLSWPTALAGFMRRPRRLPFRAYSTDDAAAYIHPFRYQMLSRDLDAMWETGSPRVLSRRCLSGTRMAHTDRPIVIVQDRFDFANFCHFLFDGVTRVLHYVEYFGYENELFVFGGIPGRYQELVGQAICEAARIPVTALYFPMGGTLLNSSRRCVWFSDQKELHTHPAQMAHPRSLAALKGVTDRLPATDSNAKRVYVSRGDADRRRIGNEAELVAALEGRGFVTVQLANVPIEEQLGLFRHAETVVAPHGMGLTHIAMGQRLGRVIELFHPQAGTDAYAYIARSAGMHYDYVLGSGIPATHSDYDVSVDRVLDLLGPDDTLRRRPNWRKQANQIPAAKTFEGFVGGTDDPREGWSQPHFTSLIADQSVRFHYKNGPAGNTLVGQWPAVDVTPKILYVVSCWIWLPPWFPGDEVSVRVDDWAPTQMTAADLSQTDRWQRISFVAISPGNTTSCAISLHVVGHEGAMLASTCWQFERGHYPTAYLPTG